jgi:hypothetical protein
VFNQLVDPLIERLHPHAITVRDQCMMFASGVIERLDRIAEAVSDDANTEYIRRYPIGQFTNGVMSPLVEVPPNEEWELEVWSVFSDTATTVRMYNDPGHSSVEPPSASIGAVLNGITDKSGNGAVFQTGTISLLAFGNGTVRAQFRCKRQRPARHNNQSAGFRNQVPDRQDGAQDAEDTQRHVGSWHPGTPVFGPSAPQPPYLNNGR